MSAFLGPIHYWLFNKITNLETIEMKIINTETPKDYMLLSKKLEDVIDQTMIHQSLQNMIRITETRFSKVVKESMEKDSFDTLKKAFIQQGSYDGSQAKDKLPNPTIEMIYKALNDFILDGMPCDTMNNIDLNQDDTFKWHTNDSLHKPFWDINDIDVDIFYQLKKEYINSFIQTFDSALSYHYTNTNTILIHEIVRR